MKIRILPAVVFSLVLGAACAQDPNQAPPAPQITGNGAGAAGYPQRGGRGNLGAGLGMLAPGRGVVGTVVKADADKYLIKNDAGTLYIVYFSANTHIMKQVADTSAGGGQGAGGGQRRGGGMGMGRGNPPQPIKSTDIKVGDTIAALGDVDPAGRSVGATGVVLLDPERVRQLEATQANFGKTWIMGKVTAIDGVKVTLTGSLDNAPHTFVADENTTFRKRRAPITLADIQVGDSVRADGALKDGAFSAISVTVMGMPQGETPSIPSNPQPQ